MSLSRLFEIRPYRAADRARVRELCCETGFLGKPIDPVFEDRELFADYLTAFYTDWEPESSWVVVVDGKICGYLMGSRQFCQQWVYSIFQNGWLFFRGAWRYSGYSSPSKKFVRWILRTAWKEVPPAPRRVAHFHINLLPEARQLSTSRALVDAFLGYLHDHGERRVYGQMVVFEDRRGVKLFERYGFKVINKAEITKYRDLYASPVYLCTVMKDLGESRKLYSNG
jgi:ribosomal protein S18 acetylase RimI-like enzyme